MPVNTVHIMWEDSLRVCSGRCAWTLSVCLHRVGGHSASPYWLSDEFCHVFKLVLFQTGSPVSVSAISTARSSAAAVAFLSCTHTELAG